MKNDEVTKRFSLFSIYENLEDEMRNQIRAPKTLADIPGSQPLNWRCFLRKKGDSNVDTSLSN